MSQQEVTMNLESLERVYTNYSSVYDQTFGKAFNQSREFAVRGLPIAPNDEVLEVGVGTGIALPLYPTHCKITGIDLSEGMLKVAQERIDEHRLNHVTLQRMDAGKMDFEDSSFDLVMAAYVVTAVPDYRKVVSEMIRVCRPGGRIVMLNHFSNGNKIIAAVEKLISPMCQRIGFRTDLSLKHVLDSTALQVTKKEKMNPLRFWDLVECVNTKNGNLVS
jgi:phosphatidylethanolamine/phosphatidyl-N-methylethanolamine N-methyltransferase